MPGDVVARGDVRILTALFLHLLLLLPFRIEQRDPHVLFHLIHADLLPSERIHSVDGGGGGGGGGGADRRDVVLADEMLGHRRQSSALHHRRTCDRRRLRLPRRRRRRRRRRSAAEREAGGRLAGGRLAGRGVRRLACSRGRIQLLRRGERPVVVILKPNRLDDDKVVPVHEHVRPPLLLHLLLLCKGGALLLAVPGGVLLHACERAQRVLRVQPQLLQRLGRRREDLRVGVDQLRKVLEQVVSRFEEVELRILALAVGDAGEEGTTIRGDELRRQHDHVQVERIHAQRPVHLVHQLRRLERRE